MAALREHNILAPSHKSIEGILANNQLAYTQCLLSLIVMAHSAI